MQLFAASAFLAPTVVMVTGAAKQHVRHGHAEDETRRSQQQHQALQERLLKSVQIKTSQQKQSPLSVFRKTVERRVLERQQSGTVRECNPRREMVGIDEHDETNSKADLGFLSCHPGEECVESELSKTGGVCIEATAQIHKRRLQSEVLCAENSCDCENFDWQTFEGTITCTLDQECVTSDGVEYCFVPSQTYYYDGDSYFTYSKSCYDFASGPLDSFCTMTSEEGKCEIKVNDIACPLCAVANCPAGSDLDRGLVWVCWGTGLQTQGNQCSGDVLLPFMAEHDDNTVAPAAPPTPASQTDPLDADTSEKIRDGTKTPDSPVAPSSAPSSQPSSPTPTASSSPSAAATMEPSPMPSTAPSSSPSAYRTQMPSPVPSSAPSVAESSLVPSVVPSTNPSAAASSGPSPTPSLDPSTMPSVPESPSPSVQPVVLVQPVAEPSSAPTAKVSSSLSSGPSLGPSNSPTPLSVQPSAAPTSQPSQAPSSAPSDAPSSQPSSDSPSSVPTTSPSDDPSTVPSLTPSLEPSAAPSVTPSAVPSITPSAAPSEEPTVVPSLQPSGLPSSAPSKAPTRRPTTASVIITPLPTEEPLGIGRLPGSLPAPAPPATTAQPTVDNQATSAPAVPPTPAPVALGTIPDTTSGASLVVVYTATVTAVGIMTTMLLL